MFSFVAIALVTFNSLAGNSHVSEPKNHRHILTFYLPALYNHHFRHSVAPVIVHAPVRVPRIIVLILLLVFEASHIDPHGEHVARVRRDVHGQGELGILQVDLVHLGVLDLLPDVAQVRAEADVDRHRDQ